MSKYGDQMGDIYGCGWFCETCSKCNPILWFGIRRDPPLPDKVYKAIDYMKTGTKKWEHYKNSIKYGLIDENYNLTDKVKLNLVPSRKIKKLKIIKITRI